MGYEAFTRFSGFSPSAPSRLTSSARCGTLRQLVRSGTGKLDVSTAGVPGDLWGRAENRVLLRRLPNITGHFATLFGPDRPVTERLAATAESHVL